MSYGALPRALGMNPESLKAQDLLSALAIAFSTDPVNLSALLIEEP